MSASKIGLIIYGLIRSSAMLHVTIESIKEYIISRNNVQRIVVDVDGESANVFKFDCNVTIVNHTDNRKKYLQKYERAMTHVVRALSHFSNEFETIIVSRIDVEYASYLSVSHILPNTIYLPDFQNYGELNDRFAYGEHQVMKRWFGKRLELAKRNIFAEKGACDAAKSMKAEIQHVGINFVRRRQNLFVPDIDKATVWKTIPLRSWMTQHNNKLCSIVKKAPSKLHL